MNYQLAKELKDAGFKCSDYVTAMYFDPSLPIDEVVPNPSLSELIEACYGERGQRFRWLKNCKDKWMAQARPEHPIVTKDIKAFGSTPEEAVARLYIELNKK